MPVASAIASAEEHPMLTVEEILAGLHGQSVSDLMRIAKAAVVESEKQFKVFEKTAGKAKKPKKAGSLPKGVLPRQFIKPNAWKAYVMADAKAHGWPAYTVTVNRKNKITGEVEPEEIEYSASEVRDGVYVFDTGRAFNEKDAMSLAKIYWDNKSQTGARKDLWRRFDEQYVEPTEDASASSATASASASASTVSANANAVTASASNAAASATEPKTPTVMKRAPKKTAA